jgi:hypothetical protein
MLIAVVPVIFMIVGLLLWALAANPKVAEAGRIMFAAGSFAICFALSGKGVTIP